MKRLLLEVLLEVGRVLGTSVDGMLCYLSGLGHMNQSFRTHTPLACEKGWICVGRTYEHDKGDKI